MTKEKEDLIRRIITMIGKSNNNPMWDEDNERELKELMAELDNMGGDSLRDFRDYKTLTM